jgi:glycosyltransferase involved in cell wall biosynthesis
MAAGVPVAVARSASLPEVCGDAALYFDPLQVEDMADKLVMIASDNELCQQFKEKGLKRSKLFTWESCSKTTAEALRASLGQSYTHLGADSLEVSHV